MEGVTMKRIPFGGLKLWLELFRELRFPLHGLVTMKRIPFGGLKRHNKGNV